MIHKDRCLNINVWCYLHFLQKAPSLCATLHQSFLWHAASCCTSSVLSSSYSAHGHTWTTGRRDQTVSGSERTCERLSPGSLHIRFQHAHWAEKRDLKSKSGGNNPLSVSEKEGHCACCRGGGSISRNLKWDVATACSESLGSLFVPRHKAFCWRFAGD